MSTDTEYLPDGDEFIDPDEEHDFSGGIYVNFSKDDAESESLDFEPVPRGKYLVALTAGEVRASKSAANRGKPYWSLEFTIIGDKAGGKYKNKKLFTNIMLFPVGDQQRYYGLAPFLKALGFNVSPGSMELPEITDLVDQGAELVVYTSIKKAHTYVDALGQEKQADDRNEVKSYFATSTWPGYGKTGAKSTEDALMP